MPLFKEHNIIRLDDLIYIENNKLMYRILNGKCAKPICNFFVNKSKVVNTRNANVAIMKQTLASVNRSFLCKLVIDWQSVTQVDKGVVHEKILAKRLKKELLLKY